MGMDERAENWRGRNNSLLFCADWLLDVDDLLFVPVGVVVGDK